MQKIQPVEVGSSSLEKTIRRNFGEKERGIM
jgi:hypothetical protein